MASSMSPRTLSRLGTSEAPVHEHDDGQRCEAKYDASGDGHAFILDRFAAASALQAEGGVRQPI